MSIQTPGFAQVLPVTSATEHQRAAAIFLVVFYFLKNSSISIKYPRMRRDERE